MANYERDKNDVRIFDGGDDEDAEGSHLPVVIIIAILVLAAFGGVVWLAYNQGVARGRNEVPVQVASNGAGGEIKVYQQPAGSEDEESVQTAPANPDTAQPKPESSPPALKPQTIEPAPQSNTAQTALAPTAPPAVAPPVKPAPQPQSVKPSPQVRTVATTAQPPTVATQAPAQLGLAHPSAPSSAAAAVAPKPAAAAAASKPAPAGSYLLQIGAYKSQDEAMTAWRSYQAKHSVLLKGFSPDVQRADLGPKGVWYRLRVSSFADKTAATALCDRLKSENGACFLAR